MAASAATRNRGAGPGRPALPTGAVALRLGIRAGADRERVRVPAGLDRDAGGYPQQTVRKVNQKYQDINAWISSVGSGVAMNDLDGDGLPNDLCITDPRIDQVVVTPVPRPGTPATRRSRSIRHRCR